MNKSVKKELTALGVLFWCFLMVNPTFSQSEKLAAAKADFERRHTELRAEKPVALNARYAEGIKGLQGKVQAAGDLTTVLQLHKELKSIEEVGAPQVQVDSKNPDFLNYRKSYKAQLSQWDAEQAKKFEVFKSEYSKTITTLMRDLTKAGQFDEAIEVEEEVKQVAKLSFGEVVNVEVATTGTMNPKEPKKEGPVDLKERQAKIQALVVIDSDSGKGYAGMASGLSVTAFREDGEEPSEVSFNQDVGKMMSTALKEVVKHITYRHDGWPKGYRMELGFDDKYTGKDGPSAAVACGLLLDSMITGDVLSNKFAVTGDMNADGSVQPIGGVGAKIRGATKGDCTVVAVPSKNERGVSDLLLLEGPEPFARIQVFSISTFEEAKSIARADRIGAEKTAIDTFETIQEVLLRNPGGMHNLLKNQHVQARLKAVLDEKPNHLSAKYLYLYGTGQADEQLSVAGSFQAIENGAKLLLDSIRSSSAQQSLSALKGDDVGRSVSHLKNMRRKLDPRLRKYNDSIVDFGLLIREIQDLPPSSRNSINNFIRKLDNSIRNINNQRESLVKDPEIIEEIEG